MMQTPVNYCTNSIPACCQPSYNAVKIDIHNPKVTDMAPQYPSAYAMPQASCYAYPQAPMPMCYPPVYFPPMMPPMMPPMPVSQGQQGTTTVPVAGEQTAQQPQPVPVVPMPVPQAPIQQVINNGVPTQQTIQQTPAQTVPVQTPMTKSTNNVVQTPQTAQAPKTEKPMENIPVVDISPVLRGLQSNNLEEQSMALDQIGEAAKTPNGIKKFLETSVLDSLLGILNADISNLAQATPEQNAARTKMVKKETMTDAEANLAMTLAPQEVAIQNKQHALYSIAILQKALAGEVEAKTGEKLSIEKLPAIDQVVNMVKSNPNPVLRASAIAALVHLDKPEYKPILGEIFQLAQNDQDPNVKTVATEALNKINGVEEAK